MFENNAENQIQFEWMMQNGQVDDPILAEALIREYYTAVLQMMMTLVDGTVQAKSYALKTLIMAVEKRHQYTGEAPLKVWLFSLAYRLSRRLNRNLHDSESGGNLLIFLRYAQQLSIREIGWAIGTKEKRTLGLLQESRSRMLDTWGHSPELPILPLGHARNASTIQDALDGVLGQEEIRSLDAHLDECKACKDYADALAAQEKRFQQMAAMAWPPQPLSEREFQEIQRDLNNQENHKAIRRRFSLSIKELSFSLFVIAIVVLLGWSGGMLKPELAQPTQTERPRMGVYRGRNTQHSIILTPQPVSPEPPWRNYQKVDTPTEVIVSPIGVLIPLRKFTGAALGDNRGRIWSATGPIALASVLQYWGSRVNPEYTVRWLRPDSRDENVLPYELIDFVEARSRMQALYRMGGTVELLRQLTREGFPAIVQRGSFLPGNTGWIGRYQVVLGYENGKGTIAVQVNFPEEGEELVREEVLEREWRAFNYAFLVVYPPEKEELLKGILDKFWDESEAARWAAQKASEDIYTTEGVDRFFAWFNRGTSLTELDDFAGAVKAYDEAFALYNALPENQRPKRILWYQTRPYWAYYYTARYQDLVRLATRTLESVESPILEESYYWRALAREALGDIQGAIADLQEAVRLNPHFTVGLEQLRRLTEET